MQITQQQHTVSATFTRCVNAIYTYIYKRIYEYIYMYISMFKVKLEKATNLQISVKQNEIFI